MDKLRTSLKEAAKRVGTSSPKVSELSSKSQAKSCYLRIMQDGVAKGYRHNAMMIVGSWMYREGFDSDMVRAALHNMRTRSHSDKSDDDIERIVQESQQYKYTCNYIRDDPYLQQFCTSSCKLYNAGTIDSTMFKTVDDLFNAAKEQVSHRKNVQFGIPSIDDATMGMEPGTFSVLFGSSGSGKTTLIVEIIKRMSLQGNHPLMVQLEMSDSQTAKVLAKVTDGIDLQAATQRIQTEFDDLLARVNKSFPNNYYITDASITLPQLRAAIQHSQVHYGTNIVVIDMLQFLHLAVKADDKFAKTAAIATQLREMAKELDVPILALHHPTKKVSMYSKPDPHDVRDAGEVLQWAYILLCVYRRKVEGEERLRVEVSKNRGKDITAGGYAEWTVDADHVVFQ